MDPVTPYGGAFWKFCRYHSGSCHYCFQVILFAKFDLLLYRFRAIRAVPANHHREVGSGNVCVVPIVCRRIDPETNGEPVLNEYLPFG